MRRVWNGTGQLQKDEAYFELQRAPNRGMLVGRPYVRGRAVRKLNRWVGTFRTAADVKACLAATIDNDEWLGCRSGMLVSAVVDDAVSALILRSWED